MKATFSKFVVLIAILCLTWTLPCVASGITTENYSGRDMLVYVPATLPDTGKRALVVVLHGGMGNAQRIESRQSEHPLNMDAIAEKDGFIVVYMNGTPVTRFFGADKLGWNAGGGCCGMSAKNNIDDITYIKGAVDYLAKKYGIDKAHVYGIGHSNGAMMTQRLFCETSLYASAISISGPLNTSAEKCPSAKGKQIMGIHGADDRNVPIEGGVGEKGISHVAYRSEEQTQQTYRLSGANYILQIVKGADHNVAHIEEVLKRTENLTVAEKAAQFFGLAK